MVDAHFYIKCQRCNTVGSIGGEPGEDPCTQCLGEGYCPTHHLKPGVVHSYEISDALDVTEYSALSVGNQAAVNIMLSQGLVNLAEGTNSRVALWALFDSESTTRANLITLLGE